MEWKRVARHARVPLFIALCVIAVFWRLALSKQYTFLESPDNANNILPWLDVQAHALRQFSLLLWDPYEAAGESLIGQVQPGVLSVFTWLLALSPFSPSGHLQAFYVNLWFVFMHCVAGWFACALFRDLKFHSGAVVIASVFYATGGYIGNLTWPQLLAAAIWTPIVFLFLLRSLRGQAPIKNACWAGILLGMSWLSGHHVPSLYLSIAVFGTGIVYLMTRPASRIQIAKRLSVVAIAMSLVSSAQVMSAIEYGKYSLRWTGAGVYTWNQRVPMSAHEDLSLIPEI